LKDPDEKEPVEEPEWHKSKSNSRTTSRGREEEEDIVKRRGGGYIH
jgi:hypothetical protein